MTLAIGAIIAIVVLFIVLQGDDDSSSDTSGTPTTTTSTKSTAKDQGPVVLEINKKGKPVGGVTTLNYHHGDKVRFKVRSAVGGDVHVHVYDIEKNVPVGKTVLFSFPAKLEGVFEVESHVGEQQIAKLKVSP